MASSPLDGLYWSFSIPLGLFNLVQDVIRANQSDPNTPQVQDPTALRQWFSQPRPAAGSPPKLTYISLGGENSDIWHYIPGVTGEYEASVGRSLDPTVWNWREVRYPLNNSHTMRVTMQKAYEIGKQNVIDAINQTSGKFALGGFSSGAAVMSQVYDEIRSGSLQHRRGDLLAGVMFGNLAREEGHTIPGGIDPGGHGVRAEEDRLVDTEELWWEFANGDPEPDAWSTVEDGPTGDARTAVYEASMGRWTGLVFQMDLIGMMAELFEDMDDIAHKVQHMWDGLIRLTAEPWFLNFTTNHNGHLRYHFPYPGSSSGRTAVQLATDYLTRVGVDYQSYATPVPVTEVLTVNFKLPLSISEVAWEELRVSSTTEVWYQDRQNNWRQVLDESRIPVSLNLSTSSSVSWYKAHFYCYPIVAKALQFRFARVYDPAVGNRPYCVGMRNGLLRRNIYQRSDGTMGIEPQQDPLGNTFTSYIKDWDATKAFDNNAATFWRSMPMPDPMAVASLGLDVRSPDGGAQLMDALYIDPVYTGQSLNIYYSNDDTVGTLKLSPITAVSTVDENTDWQLGKGRWDTSFDPGDSEYRFPFAIGPLVSQDTWIGIEWSPDFDPEDGPAQNPTLFSVVPSNPSTGQYWPTIRYDVGAAEIDVEFTDGTTVKSYSVALSPLFTPNAPLRIVVGWTYDPVRFHISVKTQDGTEIALLDSTPGDLPTLVTLDGDVVFKDFRGLFTAHVVKQESYLRSSADFQANPRVYVSPEPTVPDSTGTIAASSLDDAVYAASWTTQQHGTGGASQSQYDNKEWIPVWRNYYSQRGKLPFPEQIKAKYLKCEFYGLTEEPYPVYDSGVQTSYRTFPISVSQSVTTKHPGLLGIAAGMLALGADVILSGIGSVNWLNPSTVNNAVNSIFGQVVSPIAVQSGPGTTVTSLPNQTSLDINESTRQEVSSPWVYRRSLTNASTLAGQYLKVGGNATWGSTIANATDLIGDAIRDSFTPLVNFANDPSSLPVQGQDFWVFPGANLRLPATIMNGLTAITQVILGRKPTTENRLRFNTTQVHRYDIKTVTRDAAVAYFAGVREVQPYVTTYIDTLDPLQFAFNTYDASQWVLTNTRALDTGPVTTAAASYQIENPQFDRDILNWAQEAGVWSYDGSNVNGHWHPGSATVTADGEEKLLESTRFDVVPGVHLNASVWVKWEDLVATSGMEAIALRIHYDLDGEFVVSDEVALDYTPWPATTPGEWVHLQAALLSGTGFTVPSGVNGARLVMAVTADATEGQVWFDTVELGTTDPTEGIAYKDFLTTSTFTKVRCDFTDSGVVRSDSMWARQDPLDTNISNTALAYYTSTIPDVIPAGMWADTFAPWGSTEITWGMPRAVVAITVDPDRVFDGKRVLKFTRAGGPEEAGVKVRQTTNFTPGALFRIGCVFYRPTTSNNDNQITVRLRRVSDGVYIYEETFTPVSGFWYEHVTDFQEIPETDDQNYTVELVATGDDPDEIFLNDLYCEVANVRYFMQIGDESAPMLDVTQLRYADTSIVTCTEPVNRFALQTVILSPKAFAYGVKATPLYLK